MICDLSTVFIFDKQLSQIIFNMPLLVHEMLVAYYQLAKELLFLYGVDGFKGQWLFQRED